MVEAYRDYPDMREYLRLYKEISNIRLYTDNATLLNNWELINARTILRPATGTGMRLITKAWSAGGISRMNATIKNI